MLTAAVDIVFMHLIGRRRHLLQMMILQDTGHHWPSLAIPGKGTPQQNALAPQFRRNGPQ